MASNNPLKYSDPTGHWPNPFDIDSWPGPIDSWYKITFEDIEGAQNFLNVLDAVIQVDDFKQQGNLDALLEIAVSVVADKITGEVLDKFLDEHDITKEALEVVGQLVNSGFDFGDVPNMNDHVEMNIFRQKLAQGIASWSETGADYLSINMSVTLASDGYDINTGWHLPCTSQYADKHLNQTYNSGWAMFGKEVPSLWNGAASRILDIAYATLPSGPGRSSISR